MIKIALTLVLAAATMTAQSVSGIWEGTGVKQDPKYGAIKGHVELTLLQGGSTLSGTAKLNNNQPIQISTGSMSGSTVTFAAKTANGTVVTANLSLGSNGQLQGRMTSSTGTVYTVVLSPR